MAKPKKNTPNIFLTNKKNVMRYHQIMRKGIC